MSDQLPDGWEWAKLGDIAELVGGGTPSREHPEYFTGDIVWLTPTEIPKNRITVVSTSKERITQEGLRKSSARVLPKGSVLMTSRASIGYVAIADTEVTTNQGFASFICSNRVFNYYLAYWLFGTADFFIQEATGTTFKEITKSKLRNYSIPLPPLAEQERIVAKIEVLFSQLDAGVAALRRIQAALKRYKASVLKAACEGRLVPQDPADEPAEALLRRLGKAPLVDDDLPPLPEGWCWVRWDTILSDEEGAFRRGPFGSTLKKSIFVSSGYKVYEQYCPINDDCSFGRYYITPELFEKLRSFEVRPGDYLISCSGSLGKITRVPENSEQGIINQALLRVRISDRIIDHKFFIYYFRSSFFQDKLFDSSTGTAIPNVKGVKELKALPIPLAPIPEQIRIVTELDRRLSVAAEVEAVVAALLARSARLRQSILKQAFEGKLV